MGKALPYFFIYKILSLLAGTLSIYLGYNLFVIKISGKAGDLAFKDKDLNLTLSEAAPGTFFCVLGAIIILITIIKGFSFAKKGVDGDSENIKAISTIDAL